MLKYNWLLDTIRETYTKTRNSIDIEFVEISFVSASTLVYNKNIFDHLFRIYNTAFTGRDVRRKLD